MQPPHLTPGALAVRWGTKPDTLNHWRWNGKGPKFLKLGRHVRYRLVDVEAFENQHCYASTSAFSLDLLEQKKRD